MNVSTIQKPFSSVNRQVTRHPLDSIFAPKSVAVVGATEKTGSVGRTVLWNLMNTPFGGPIYPVNPQDPRSLRAGPPEHQKRCHREEGRRTLPGCDRPEDDQAE